MAMDLQGPLDDFYKRTQQLRSIIVAIESAAKVPGALATVRPGVILSNIGLETGNTANAMSLVFLASSFEEFIREEVGQCADYLAAKYSALPAETQNSIRSLYWSALLDRLILNRNILTKGKPKVPNPSTIGQVKALLDSGRGFVVNDDSTYMDRGNFYRHSHNFRPNVVNEICNRIGINDIIASSSDNAKMKAYFGVNNKSDSSKKLVSKLDEFYERRNEVVHSLSAAKGYGVDLALDYIEIFELTAEAIVGVLNRSTARW